MGYRSDVGIALYTKDYNAMFRRAKALKKNKEPYNLITRADKYIASGGSVTILYFSNIKWYTAFKEVQWVENFIQKVPSAFVRTGEDLDDNVEDCYNEGYDLLEYCFLTRMIDISGDKQIEEDENLNELLDEIDRRL